VAGEPVDAGPAAPEVVERVVLLVDHHDVLDPLEGIVPPLASAVAGRDTVAAASSTSGPSVNVNDRRIPSSLACTATVPQAGRQAAKGDSVQPIAKVVDDPQLLR
jgi:hypothetical protein